MQSSWPQWRQNSHISRWQYLLVNALRLPIALLGFCVCPGKQAAIMPRSGYSREDRVASRSGYVSHNHDPVDHRGGPESHSGRINRARMSERASPDTFPFSLEPQAVGLHIPRGQLYSSSASSLSGTPPRDDLYRSEPSQEYERRTRGYNPGFYGERVSSFGSSPQLRALDHGYRGKVTPFPSRTYLSLTFDAHEDEGYWPRNTPIERDHKDYKRDEYRGDKQASIYERNEEDWKETRSSTAYRPPHVCIYAQTWLV